MASTCSVSRVSINHLQPGMTNHLTTDQPVSVILALKIAWVYKWFCNMTEEWHVRLDFQTLWNTGYMLPSGALEYPVETFWAERFLKYPNEVISGPIRKPEWSMHETRGRSSQKTVEDDRTAKILSGSSSTAVLLCAIAAGLTHIAGLKGTDRTQLSNLICSRLTTLQKRFLETHNAGSDARSWDGRRMPGNSHFAAYCVSD
ncbi:hypothetical protein QBC37DRAFT_407005 [Rhypophila decipiens]|uniref:Uncharacterized protein n=1 Tax=Rhypophila decipiens TaxID=261697 RepID=A0AAN6XTY6_9PEZI|nr:hypothetical protein QBC37DRAFT_407005 [Rhypophila decipiens]